MKRMSRQLPFSLAALALAPPASAHLLGLGGDSLRWWQVDPVAVVLLLLTAVLYQRGMRRIAAHPQSDPAALRRRRRCFWWGWGLLFLALGSPLDPVGEELFAAHMLQHEIMMLLAAPLLVLSKPSAALLRGGPAWMSRVFAGGARQGGLLRGWQVLVSPAAAWVIHLIGLWAWHVPALFSAGLRNDAVHALQHLSFLLIGLLFWWALLRSPASRAGRLYGVLYLFTTALHASLLGALLTFSPRVWYTPYQDTAPAWGLSALEDQQLGGLIMWMPAGVVFILAALWVLAQSLNDLQRGQTLYKLQEAAARAQENGDGKGRGQ